MSLLLSPRSRLLVPSPPPGRPSPVARFKFANTECPGPADSSDVAPNGLTCSPGRFFVAIALKTIVAYLVVNYDLKVSGDGGRPANVYFANAVLPNQKGQVMFRKRQSGSGLVRPASSVG